MRTYRTLSRRFVALVCTALVGSGVGAGAAARKLNVLMVALLVKGIDVTVPL